MLCPPVTRMSRNGGGRPRSDSLGSGLGQSSQAAVVCGSVSEREGGRTEETKDVEMLWRRDRNREVEKTIDFGQSAKDQKSSFLRSASLCHPLLPGFWPPAETAAVLLGVLQGVAVPRCVGQE